MFPPKGLIDCSRALLKPQTGWPGTFTSCSDRTEAGGVGALGGAHSSPCSKRLPSQAPAFPSLGSNACQAGCQSPWGRDSNRDLGMLLSLWLREALLAFHLLLSGPRWNWLTKTAPGRGCGWQARHFTDTGRNSRGGATRFCPQPYCLRLWSHLILSAKQGQPGQELDIRTQRENAGQERDGPWSRDSLLGLGSASWLYTSQKIQTLWFDTCHCLFPEYMQIFCAHPCLVCRCHRKWQNRIKIIGQPP